MNGLHDKKPPAEEILRHQLIPCHRYRSEESDESRAARGEVSHKKPQNNTRKEKKQGVRREEEEEEQSDTK